MSLVTAGSWSQHVHSRMDTKTWKLGHGLTWSDNVIPNDVLDGSSCALSQIFPLDPCNVRPLINLALRVSISAVVDRLSRSWASICHVLGVDFLPRRATPAAAIDTLGCNSLLQ